MRTKKIKQELKKIGTDAIKVACIIKILRDACERNNLEEELETLEIAFELQNNLAIDLNDIIFQM